MPLDFTQCEIRTPVGPERADLYRMLGETFPPDQPLFDRLLRTGRPMYTWTPYTLYGRDAAILGNVALMPVRIRLQGKPLEVVGVASVATAPQCRRQGVARHLLQHCLAVVDQQRLPAVLFTSQPEVYAGVGFTRIPQQYHEWHEWQASQWPRHNDGLHSTRLAAPTPEDWTAAARLYDAGVPYDGLVVRDAAYWELYQTLFHLNPRWHLTACREGDAWLGYARCEEEAGRLLISEFCCNPAREEVAQSLLESIVEQARQLGRPVISLALAPGHFLVPLLRSRGVKLAAEGADAGREAFMVRPAAGQSLGPLGQLQWSLADKF